MGIHGEVPGEKYRSALDPYRDSAAAIEASELDYTILRPGWFNREPFASYRLTGNTRLPNFPQIMVRSFRSWKVNKPDLNRIS